jgi:hypothetical protein
MSCCIEMPHCRRGKMAPATAAAEQSSCCCPAGRRRTCVAKNTDDRLVSMTSCHWSGFMRIIKLSLVMPAASQVGGQRWEEGSSNKIGRNWPLQAIDHGPAENLSDVATLYNTWHMPSKEAMGCAPQKRDGRKDDHSRGDNSSS